MMTSTIDSPPRIRLIGPEPPQSAFVAARPPLANSWSLLFVILIATIWLYQSPYNVSDLTMEPDSVEYALAPLQFLETGRYEIIVQGHALPPRYPPWFSVMVIAPAYALFGHQPGNAILPITGLGLAGIAFAWAIGKRIAAGPGAILAGLSVLAIPAYSMWAGYVMTDVPCTAIMLGTCLLYLRLRSQPSSTWFDLLAGILVAIAMLLRPVFAATLLPFALLILQSRQRFVSRFVVLLLPVATAMAATLTYNWATFGSPLRNGYQFWTPVPYDYPSLVFSLRYVLGNAQVILHTAFPILFLTATALWWILKTRDRDGFDAVRRPLWHTLTFLILTTVPILCFHLIYFFPADRFYLPMLAGMAILGSALTGQLIRNRWTRVSKLLLPGALLVVIGLRMLTSESLPLRRMAADRVRKYTPENAIVISEIDPVYLERMAARGTSRRIVPLSREVEYASKLLAPARIDNPQPPPANWHDHRSVGLIRGGAKEAVPFVATEQVENLAEEAQRGTAVFLEGTFLAASDASAVTELKRCFGLTRRAPGLYELLPR